MTAAKKDQLEETVVEEAGDLMSDFANAGSGMDDDETMDMDTSDVFDETVHPTGTECKLRIVRVDPGTSVKTEANFWRITLEDAEDPHVKRLSYFLWFLGPKDDVRKKNNQKKAFLNFKRAFGIPDEEPLRKNDLPGKEAWALLVKKESIEYGEQNDVSKWIVGGSSNSVF